MKVVKRTHMESFEGRTLKEFSDDFNRKMEMVAQSSGSYSKLETDLSTLRGYVIYEQTAKIPENLRDRLDLEGLRVFCGQCKYFNASRYNWGECKHTQGELRKNDEACERFFYEWEHGQCWLKDGEERIYVDAINKS